MLNVTIIIVMRVDINPTIRQLYRLSGPTYDSDSAPDLAFLVGEGMHQVGHLGAVAGQPAVDARAARW